MAYRNRQLNMAESYLLVKWITDNANEITSGRLTGGMVAKKASRDLGFKITKHNCTQRYDIAGLPPPSVVSGRGNAWSSKATMREVKDALEVHHSWLTLHIDHINRIYKALSITADHLGIDLDIPGEVDKPETEEAMGG